MDIEDKTLSSSKNVPIIIVTGFFGSGKTTLIKYIMSTTDKKIGIVENDLAEINIDGKILSLTPGKVEVISNACICCSKGIHVAEAIDRLLVNNANLEYILVETTGLANPKKLCDSLYGVNIKHGVKLIGTCCVVDAKNYFDHSQIQEQNMQIIYSDTVLVSKIDLVKDNEALEKTKQSILQLNPTCNIKGIINGNLSLESLAEHILTAKYTFKEPTVDLGKPLHHDVSTISYSWDKEINPLKVVTMLKKFVQDGTFVRAKGVFKFPKDNDMYLFQAVERDVILTQEPYDGTHKSSMVFIGKNLNKEDIIRVCEDCIL